jgi:tripartite-type tricarboxylate transporter receptor subunit TctC
LANPAFSKRLLDQGLMPNFEGPQALGARLDQNRAQFRELIQAAGIRAE